MNLQADARIIVGANDGSDPRFFFGRAARDLESLPQGQELRAAGFIPHELAGDALVSVSPACELAAGALVIHPCEELLADAVVSGSGRRLYPLPRRIFPLPNRLSPVV